MRRIGNGCDDKLSYIQAYRQSIGARMQERMSVGIPPSCTEGWDVSLYFRYHSSSEILSIQFLRLHPNR